MRVIPFTLIALATVVLSTGCSQLATPQLHTPGEDGPKGPPAISFQFKDKDENGWITALLYLPNRILDLGDIPRAGVNIGPGFGIDAQATEYAKLAYINNVSVGIGFQTFRKLPVCARQESKAAIGPAEAEMEIQFGFEPRFYDVGLEAYPFVAGAHAYIDFSEILDFIAGFALIDTNGDDITIP